VLVTASYIGVLPARLVHDHLPRAVIGFDGGVGPQGANIAGLWYFEALNVPAAAVDVMSIILGDGVDTYHNGRISFVNRPAQDCGVEVGMPAHEAARLMLEHEPGTPSGYQVCLLLRRPRRVGARCGASVGRSALNAPTSRRCSGLRPHRATRCAPCGRSAQTSAMSQFTNALRAGPQALRASAPHRRAAPGPHTPWATSFWWAVALSAVRLFGSDSQQQSLRQAFCKAARPACRRSGLPSLHQSVAAGAARWGRFGGLPRNAAAGAVRAAHFVNSDSSRLSERSARRARSELRDAPRRRVPQVVGAFSARPSRL
jgi:hypothetical protein